MLHPGMLPPHKVASQNMIEQESLRIDNPMLQRLWDLVTVETVLINSFIENARKNGTLVVSCGTH